MRQVAKPKGYSQERNREHCARPFGGDTDGIIWSEGTNGLVWSTAIRGMVKQASRTETLLCRGVEVF